MRNFTRRELMQMLMAAPALAGVAHAHSAFALAGGFGKSVTEEGVGTDWSREIVETTLKKFPDASKFGGWGYAKALYLYGQYLVYQRTGDRRYLSYIQGWIDSHVNAEGVIDRPISALDFMLPGNLLLVLHKETGEQKYKTAADTIRHRLDTYPRTTDGGFWHALSRQHQLWLDGMYMSMPFLVRYGEMYHDQKYAYDEATKQLLIYAKHLNDPASGLLFHAYDESGKQVWADPVTHHSSIFWCRSIGWYGMALIEVLEKMPHHHAQRQQLIALVQQLVAAYKRYQDPKTGRWFQVVDKGNLPANWLETSSSCMFIYTIGRAVQRHYVDKQYMETLHKGYAGVLTQLSRDNEGEAHLANICIGTNVGDLDFYLARPRATDDFHGLGAFLIMNEFLRSSQFAKEMNRA